MAGAPPDSVDVVVVGGGVIGCAAAWFLTREGLSVELLESDELASQASGAAAGMLAPISEGGVPGPLLHFGREALAAFPALCEELCERSGIDPELERSGILRVAQREEEEAALRTRVFALAEANPRVPAEVEWVDASEAAAIQPGLAPDVRGGLWCPSEANLRSPLLARAYAGAARSLGARITTATPVLGLACEGTRVVGVRTAGRRIAAGQVVVATGSACASLREWLPPICAAPALPVEPVRGQILSLDPPGPPLRTIVWGAGAYLVPKRNGSVVVGATEEHVGFDCRVTVDGLARLLDAAPRLVPGLARAGFRRGWAGLRPGSPDELPAIGALPGCEGLQIAVGHYRNGVLLSPVTGALLRDLVLGKEPGPAAEVFRPSRWFGSSDDRDGPA